MKTLSTLAVLWILTACSGNKPPVKEKVKSYTLRMVSKENSAVARYDDRIRRYEILAKSDSEAYEKGLSTFASWQQSYGTRKTSTSLWKPESFSMQDDEGKDFLKQLGASTRQAIQNKLKNSNVAKDTIESHQRSIAFKSWRFGLNEKNYSTKETGYQSLGKEMYFFKPLFEDSVGLYMVILESPERNAKHFETKIKEATENLYEVFSKQHGPGTKLNSFPAVKNMARGFIEWLHEWNIGKTNIKIGISALLNGVEFYSVCWITDKELYAAQQEKSRNKLSDEKKAKDVKKN